MSMKKIISVFEIDIDRDTKKLYLHESKDYIIGVINNFLGANPEDNRPIMIGDVKNNMYLTAKALRGCTWSVNTIQ